jgi:hypothetical protein
LNLAQIDVLVLDIDIGYWVNNLAKDYE